MDSWPNFFALIEIVYIIDIKFARFLATIIQKYLVWHDLNFFYMCGCGFGYNLCGRGHLHIRSMLYVWTLQILTASNVLACMDSFHAVVYGATPTFMFRPLSITNLALNMSSACWHGLLSPDCHLTAYVQGSPGLQGSIGTPGNPGESLVILPLARDHTLNSALRTLASFVCSFYVCFKMPMFCSESC
jgi:hypothetical protein